MKKIAFSVLLAGILISCKENKPANLILVMVTDSVINTMQGGFGASMHAIEDSLPVSTYEGGYRSYGGSVWGGNPVAEDTARWNQIYKHAEWLGLDWCRVEIDHGMFEPQKGKFSFDNKEMRILYRWLDYCQSHEVDVYFTEMWPDAKWLVHKNFLGDGIKELLSAPNDFNAWADGYVKLLSYLVIDKKYSCIKWISINNEPMEPWSWWKKTDGSSQDIIDGLTAMKKRLDAAKLPVKLVATDGPIKYEEAAVKKYIPYIGAFSFHDYGATYDWWKNKPFIADDVDAISIFKKLGRENGNLPVFMAEFGTMMFGFTKDTNAPSQWRSMLHDVQMMIRMSQAGIDGMNRWSFTNVGNLDGTWQLIDTWDTTKKCLTEKVTPHMNAYYGLGMMMRFTAKYSDVLKTTVTGAKDTIQFERLDKSKDMVRRIFATTFKKGDSYSIFITNDSEKEFQLEISLKKINKNLTLYLYAINEKDHEGKTNLKIEPIGEFNTGKDAEINGIIKPKSLMVYTTYKLGAGDKGIVK
jgi:hypothetical protein